MSKNNKNGNKNNHGWRCKRCGVKAKTQRTSMGGLRVTANGERLRATGIAVVMHRLECPNYGQPNNWS